MKKKALKKKPIKKVTKKLPKKKVLTKYVKSGTELHVLEIEDNTDSMISALGIIPERAKQLEEVVLKTFAISKNCVAAMAIISKEVKHANELYFASMMMTEVMSRARNPLHAIFAHIGRGSNTNEGK